MGKWCLQASLFIFYQIFVKLAGNQDRHKISHEFEFRPDRISHFGLICPWGRIKFSIDILWKLPSSVDLLNIRVFRHTFLGNCEAQKIETWYTCGQWADVSCTPESGCCCLFVPLFLHFSFSPILNIEIFRHFSRELWGLEDWKVAHTWTVGRCIKYLESGCCSHSSLNFLHFSFSSIFNFEIFGHTFLRHCEA